MNDVRIATATPQLSSWSRTDAIDPETAIGDLAKFVIENGRVALRRA